MDVLGVSVVDLSDALDRLADLDARQSRVVELRFFTGLSIEETAEVLEVSPATVKRDWQRAWLNPGPGREERVSERWTRVERSRGGAPGAPEQRAAYSRDLRRRSLCLETEVRSCSRATKRPADSSAAGGFPEGPSPGQSRTLKVIRPLAEGGMGASIWSSAPTDSSTSAGAEADPA